MAPKMTPCWIVGVVIISCWNLRPCSAVFNADVFFKNKTQGAIDFCNQIADDCSVNTYDCPTKMIKCRDHYSKWTETAMKAAEHMYLQCKEKDPKCVNDEPPPYCSDDYPYTDDTCKRVRDAECYNVHLVCKKAKEKCNEINGEKFNHYPLRNCSGQMQTCMGDLGACFNPQSDPCPASLNNDCSVINKECLYAKLCHKDLVYKKPPEYEKSSCVWANETLSENYTAAEIQMRTQHLIDYSAVPRSFDDFGNIMINANQPLPFKFPVMFTKNNARLELIVCELPEIPNTDCPARKEDNDLRTLLSLKLEGNVKPCVVPVFEKGLRGVRGICRRALWDVRNGIGSVGMKVNIQSNKNCKLTIKIKSGALEVCQMDWNIIADSKNDGSGDIIHKHIVAIGTTRSLRETTEQKTEQSDVNQTTGANKETESHKKIRENKDTETSSHQLDLSMGLKAELGASYAAGGDNGPKLEGKRDLHVNNAFKRGWLNEQEKSTKHEDDSVISKGDSDTDKTSEDYSETSRVTHAMTTTTTYTVETTVTIKPGSAITTQQLQLKCSDLEHGTPYYRSYSGSKWDPGNEVKLDWKNTTETKNGVSAFQGSLFCGMVYGIHALKAAILVYFEIF